MLLCTHGWVVSGTDANTEIGSTLVRPHDHSRGLMRNSLCAAKAVQGVVNNLMGTETMARAREVGFVHEAADRLWARFTET